MKKLIIVAIFLLAGGLVFGQVGSPDPERIGIETAQMQLMEVSVDKFEHDGFWRSHISPDFGFATSRLFYGNPAGKVPIPEEEGLDIQDIYVFGTRVDFFRRGHSSLHVYPTRPIPIEGITKTVSVWVAGRNFNHKLVLVVEDFFGRYYEFFMGRLNFMGWKRMVVAIPPQSEDGFSGVVQRNFHYNNQMGIKVLGFRIDFSPMEAMGSYYLYFDDLRAVTDLFAEHNRDPDDMVDGW